MVKGSVAKYEKIIGDYPRDDFDRFPTQWFEPHLETHLFKSKTVKKGLVIEYKKIHKSIPWPDRGASPRGGGHTPSLIEVKSSFTGYPQWIAVTRLLYQIQAPDAYKSSTSDSPPLSLIAIRAQDGSRFQVGPSAPNATHSTSAYACHSQTR
jgi:hypothetical protein